MMKVFVFLPGAEDKPVPFVEYDTSPQDLDALMSLDREIFDHHPEWNKFARRCYPADGPEGRIAKGGPGALEALRKDFWKGIKTTDTTIVTRIGPGLRAREFYAGLRLYAQIGGLDR